MSSKFRELDPKHINFIGDQHLFFVGTAGAEGSVNISPKGMDSLRVMSPTRVLWLNLTGSGNETAAHVLESPRMTLMFCSFGKQPLILRLYGEAKVFHSRDSGWQDLAGHFPDYLGTRQIFDLRIDLVQTSCGYSVPFYELKGERPTLEKWAQQRGREGVEQYWADANVISLDGKDTGMFDADSSR